VRYSKFVPLLLITANTYNCGGHISVSYDVDTTDAVDARHQRRRSIRQLHDAVTRDDVTALRQLTTPTSASGQLDYDVDGCYRGVTALQSAARRGSSELCRCLLVAGADPERCDSVSGDTALHAAARAGHVDVVRVLLDARADAEVTDCNGATALAAAAQAWFTVRVYTDRTSSSFHSFFTLYSLSSEFLFISAPNKLYVASDGNLGIQFLLCSVSCYLLARGYRGCSTQT